MSFFFNGGNHCLHSIQDIEEKILQRYLLDAKGPMYIILSVLYFNDVTDVVCVCCIPDVTIRPCNPISQNLIFPLGPGHRSGAAARLAQGVACARHAGAYDSPATWSNGREGGAGVVLKRKREVSAVAMAVQSTVPGREYTFFSVLRFAFVGF